MNPSAASNLYLRGAYSLAEGAFDSVIMPDPEHKVGKATYDYSGIHEYSDIEQTRLEVSLGGSTALTDGISVYGDLSHFAFEDNEEYVYGDLTGSFSRIMIGTRISL